MGSIHEPPLSSFALELARAVGLRDFVETGTFVGSALDWAAHNFERVWTIEIEPQYQLRARETNQAHSNIYYFLGDSARELSKVVAQIDGPALCWLDAHAGAGYFAPEENCPLLAELESVLRAPYEHCIFIDDARAFIAPPPPPFVYQKWPTLDEIFSCLATRRDYHAVIIADTLIAVPLRFRDLVANFCFRVRPQI